MNITTVYEALSTLGVRWYEHIFRDGALLFCTGAEGSFDLMLKNDGILRLWRFVEPDACADPTLQNVVFCLPDGTGSIFGYARTEDGDLCVCYQADLRRMEEDAAEITRLVRLFLALSARIGAA